MTINEELNQEVNSHRMGNDTILKLEDDTSRNKLKRNTTNKLLCPRCMESGHWENTCPIITSSTYKLLKCDICEQQGHALAVHSAKYFKQRRAIVRTLGWKPFQGWFLEFDFRNWWQSNARIGVPLYKIFRTQDGNLKQWKDWKNFVPRKPKNFVTNSDFMPRFQQPNTFSSSTARAFPYSQKDLYQPISLGYGSESSYPPSSKEYKEIEFEKHFPEQSVSSIQSNKNGYGTLNNAKSTVENKIYDKFGNIPNSNKPKPASTGPPTPFSKMSKINFDPTNSNINTSHPSIGLNWAQNDRLIVIEVEIEGVRLDQVQLSWDDKSVTVEVHNKAQYYLEIQLANPITKNFGILKLTPTKLKVKVKKDHEKTIENDGQWLCLYMDSSSTTKVETS